jgi:type III secretion protein D
MTSADMLEVRILAGVHRHAHCAVHDGAIVGASQSCDIVLQDDYLPAQAARLRVHQHGWQLQILDADRSSDGTPDEILGFGQPAWVGAVCITISPPGAPWREPTLPPQPPQEDAHPQAEPAQASSGDSSSIAAAMQQRRPSSSSLGSKRTGRALALVGFAALVLAALAWPITVLLPASDEHEAPVNGPPQLQIGSDDRLSRAMEAVDALQLASDVHVARREDGTIWITGWVQTEAQCDRLAAALAHFDPQPILRIGCAGRTESALHSALDGFDAIFRVRHLGDGRFQVRAIAANADVRMAMMAALDKASSSSAVVVVQETDVLLASEIDEQFQNRLRHAGLPPLLLTWEARAFRVRTSGVSKDQARRLGSLIDGFNKDQMDVLHATHLDRSTPGLPFQVCSVIGGPQPWLLLEDGTKLLVGGTHCDYRLVAIEDTQIVFDAGGTVTIPR